MSKTIFSWLPPPKLTVISHIFTRYLFIMFRAILSGRIFAQVEGEDVFCKEGVLNLFDRCDGCLPEDVLYGTDEFYWYMTEGGCGEVITVGGMADLTLDFLTGAARRAAGAALAAATRNASALTARRSRTSLMGYSLGGLFACYGAWTRPEVHSSISCKLVS